MLRWPPPLYFVLLTAVLASPLVFAHCPADRAATDSAISTHDAGTDTAGPPTIRPIETTGAAHRTDIATPVKRGPPQDPRARWHRFLPGMFK